LNGIYGKNEKNREREREKEKNDIIISKIAA